MHRPLAMPIEWFTARFLQFTIKPMKIWALTDKRVGNNKQALALATALGEFEEIHVEYSPLASLPNCLLGTSAIGIKINFSGEPDLVISAGRKLSRVARYLKKQYGCKIIQIMWPGFGAKDFDYIIVPEHDQIPDAANIIKITGSISPLRPAGGAVKDKATVLIGDMTEREAKKLCAILNQNPFEYQITTSRRTNPKAIAVLEKNFEIYKFGSGRANPYEAYLATAEVIVVTGDSTNMITEAAHTGKPVYIFETETKPKFKKFWQRLYSLGCARKLTNRLEAFDANALDNIGIIKNKLVEITQ